MLYLKGGKEMMKSQLKIKEWNEQFIFNEEIAKTNAIYQIEGKMKGIMRAEYNIFYLYYDKKEVHNSTSVFNGFTKFQGEIGNKSGSFIMEDRGSFIDNKYSTSLKIIKGSGTGDFEKKFGSGTYYPTENGMTLELSITTN